MAIPFPDTPGGLYFDGQNVINFIENYKNICLDYYVFDFDCYKRLPKFCELLTGKYIAQNWPKLVRILKIKYKTMDTTQQMHSKKKIQFFFKRRRQCEVLLSQFRHDFQWFNA